MPVPSWPELSFTTREKFTQNLRNALFRKKDLDSIGYPGPNLCRSTHALTVNSMPAANLGDPCLTPSHADPVACRAHS